MVVMCGAAFANTGAESDEPGLRQTFPKAACGARAVQRILRLEGKLGANPRLIVDLLRELNGQDWDAMVPFPRLRDSLISRGVNCEFRDVSAVSLDGLGKHFIVHINGNHFAVVEKLDHGFLVHVDEHIGIEMTPNELLKRCSSIFLDTSRASNDSKAHIAFTILTDPMIFVCAILILFIWWNELAAQYRRLMTCRRLLWHRRGDE